MSSVGRWPRPTARRSGRGIDARRPDASSSSAQMRSRPRRQSRTRPALASACRCLVIAWRVTLAPSLSLAIDKGPSTQSRATTVSRVGSPRAANTGAASANLDLVALQASETWRWMLHVCFGPSLIVHTQRLVAASPRDFTIEAQFDNGEQGAPSESSSLNSTASWPRISSRRMNEQAIRVPAIGEIVLGFDEIDLHGHRHVLVSRISDWPRIVARASTNAPSSLK